MKYVLCRPMGGLNDVLVKIMRAYSYCEVIGRTLLIDTEYNSKFFYSSFDHYFTFTDKAKEKVRIITNYKEIVKLIQNGDFSVYPRIPKDRLFDYKTAYNHELAYGYYIDEFKLPAYAVLDPTRNYEEDIILYNTCGGGDISQPLMSLLTVNDWIVKEFAKRYNSITKPYTSIHIRNTDYKTDYIDFYNKNKERIDNKVIFLATDSKETLNFFASLDITLFTYIQSLKEDNMPLHCVYEPEEKKRQVIVDTLCDLFMLALGNTFILTDEIHKVQSGFTKLAYYLFKNKGVVFSMIGGRDALV